MTSQRDAPSPDASHLLARLAELRSRAVSLEASHEGPRDPSAANLLHYLALRRQNLRDLHVPLAELGLSSLGRCEPCVLATLDGVMRALRALHPDLAGAFPSPALAPGQGSITLSQARDLLERRTHALLGPGRAHDASGVPLPVSRIMVTLPSQAASDPGLVRALIDAGMACARINTAHDDADTWARMSAHVREQARLAGVQCAILLDLAGPKLRTGPMRPGPRVAVFRPVRDALGRVVSPALVPLRPASLPHALTPALEPVPEVPVPDDWARSLRVGDQIAFTDTRGRHRLLRVCDLTPPAHPGRILCHCLSTAYVGTGTTLRLLDHHERPRDAVVGEIPALRQFVVVRTGDELVISRTAREGTPPVAPGDPPVLTCTLSQAFDGVRAGQPVWFDDGKVGARVERIEPDHVLLRITHASPLGDKIREDKGINLPETDIPLAGLTQADIAVLPVAVRHADLVSLSFVQEARDVRDLRQRLDALGGHSLGIVLKIETRRAFDNLPTLLLESLRSPAAGVMIARGDLAVEVGYERLAEVQEEVLWLCEAAHTPVIWATQVLEGMAKTGRPTRAEVTDAAMGERAECVMLNKGPNIVETVRFLAGLMRRMDAHQSKKRQVMRPLRVASRFDPAGSRPTSGTG